MKYIPNVVFTYTYEQVTYCVRLIKPIDSNTWDVVVEGIIAPKKKLEAFSRKYSILQLGTELRVREDKLEHQQRVIGLVVDHIGYIDRQIYLYEEDGQIEEAKKWKTYRLQFLPSVTLGGIA